MNQSFSKLLKTIIVYVLLPFAIVKIIYAVMTLLFLSKDDVAPSKTDSFPYHYSMDLGKKILSSSRTSVPAVKQIEATNRIKDISLKGTYLEDANSFIVIEDHLGTTFLYKGDRYVGYILKEIYDGRAIFEKNGKNYDLVIEEESKGDQSTHTSGSSYSGGSSAQASGSGDSFEPVAISHQEIDSYIKNPNKIWKNIRIQEMRKNGQIEGFRVNYIKKGSFFDQSGLKSGDVIKAIDGSEIHSLSDVMKYYNNINNLDGLSLTVLRGGNEVELEFNIN